MRQPIQSSDSESEAQGSDGSIALVAHETTPLMPKGAHGAHEATELPWITLEVKLCVCAFLLFASGVSMFTYVEGWTVGTAVYACVQIITTIGYGDFTIKHDKTKLFLCFYIFAGLTLTVVFANTVFEKLAEKHRDFIVAKMTKVEEKMQAKITRTIPTKPAEGAEEAALAEQQTESSNLRYHPASRTQSTIGHIEHQKKRAERQVRDFHKYLLRYNRVIIAVVPMMVDIAFGTLFYGYFEACTCSYGETKVSGCRQDTFQWCVSTGGYTKTWLSAFYMSVMTVSTVGIGDYSPRSQFGRAVASVWMLVGVITFAHGVKELSEFFVEQSSSFRMGKKDAAVDRKTFDEMDKDGNGELSRAEFRGYFLVKNGLVSQEHLDQIDKYYDKIDRDKTNSVSYDMMIAAVGSHHEPTEPTDENV